MSKLVVIVPAAGVGKRMGLGYNKAFAKIGGVPILVYCMAMLARTQLVDEAIVVLGETELAAGEAMLAQYQEKYFSTLRYQLVAGGKERQDSVMNALAVVPEDADYIAVHDGARPFAGTEVFKRTLAAAKQYGAAIATVPVKDTIKVVDDNGVVVSTLERSTLQAVQTPQIFEAELLLKAYDNLVRHPMAVTDDASVVELYGHKVCTVMGRYENIKLTTPEDLIWAERLLQEEE